MGKVKFGLSNVHIAPFTINEEGKYEYETPFKLPGAVNLSLEASGDSNDFHADNTIYFSASDNQGYEGDLEIAMITNEFRTKILGETTDESGFLFENKNDIIKPFAIGFQVEGDEKARKFWYYNAVATRPANNASTTEGSKEPSTDTLSIKTMPRLSDGLVKVIGELNESNSEAYNAFFTKVVEKAEAV